MTERVFFTDSREQVLRNEYDGTDAALRNQKSRLRKSARTALHELIQVANSPEIENADIFEPDDIYALLLTLLDGPADWSFTDTDHPLPDTEYRNALYVAIENAQLDMERTTDSSDLYELFGERAATLRNQNRGHAPDKRNIDDISTAEKCHSCGWEPASVILSGGDWECYNCGDDPSDDTGFP